MADAPPADRRMSDSEGVMWRLEKDPYLTSSFATVSILDHPPDFDRLRARMDRATAAVPRLRWRVQPAPVNLSPPTWVDDPDFELDGHLRRIALPRPGSLRQLLDLATLITLDPFERTRPLWQFTVIEGLRGGKAALIQKLHHSITDGEGGVQMALQYLDMAPDAPSPEPIARFAADVIGPPPAPTTAETVRDLVAGSLRLPLGIVRQVKELLADPAAIPAATSAAVDTLRSTVSQLSEVDQARSPLWRPRSLRRRLEVVRAPFTETKDAARRLGGSLNTAFVTAAAEAAARYHIELGEPVDQLRASMAVSTRTESAGANAFSLVRMLVPTADMPIADRFAAINEIATAARSTGASTSLDAISAVAAALPTSLITRLVRQQTQSIDFATSNVRGSPVPVYVAGARLLENYPIGPLLGVAFNLTLLSYAGSLDMGLNVDAAAVADPERLAKLLDRAFTDLQNA